MSDRKIDRRMARTRKALIGAFNDLVRAGRHREIRVPDIVRQADVGRSTFYDHYSGARDIHLDALRRPFAIVADAATGRGEPTELASLLAHFWENRSRARESFVGKLGTPATRMLAALILERLPADPILAPPLAAAQLAEAALAPVRAWLHGDAPASPKELAEAICRTGRAMTDALAGPAGESGDNTPDTTR